MLCPNTSLLLYTNFYREVLFGSFLFYELQLTLEKSRVWDTNTPHIQKSMFNFGPPKSWTTSLLLTRQILPSNINSQLTLVLYMYYILYTYNKISWRKYFSNCYKCPKNFLKKIHGPSKFKPMLFKGQMYVNKVVIGGASTCWIPFLPLRVRSIWAGEAAVS